jgi:hypothetical protein
LVKDRQSGALYRRAWPNHSAEKLDLAYLSASRKFRKAAPGRF